MPGTFFTSVGAFSNEDIDNILEPRQAQFPATPPTGLLDNGTDISELYAPVSVGSPSALTGYLVNGVDIANIFAMAGSVTVDYTATPAAGTVDEGASLTINVAGTNTPAATLYWTINHGTTSAADFSANSGSFSFNGTTGSFSITAVADSLTEGNETFTVQVRTGSTGGTIVATTSTITVVDTSQGSFTLGGPASMDEGVTVDFPFSGVGIPQQMYYWRIEDITTLPEDFSSPLSGSFSYVGSPVNISVTTVADAASEGEETFRLAVYEDVGYTTEVVGRNIAINDTSSLSVSFSVEPATVDEGATANYTVTGTGDVQDLYWTIDFNSSTDAGDFVATEGSFAFDGTTGTFGVQIAADAATEGEETFRVQLRSGSTLGPILDTSVVCTIQDTSTGWSLSGPANVNEGATATFNILGGTAQTVYWTVDPDGGTGAASEPADFSATSGSYVYNGTSGSFGVDIVADATTEDSETFTVQLRTGSTGGPIVATSNSVTINDTSQTPVPTYDILGAPTTVDEGDSVTFTITTTDVADGTTLYWTTTGAGVTGADFTDGLTSGSVIINSNTGSVVRTLEQDASTGEGVETFQLELRTGSVGGTIVDTSNTITVNDTSAIAWTGDTAYNWIAENGRPDVDQIGAVSFEVRISQDGTWDASADAHEKRTIDEIWQSNPGAATIYNGTWVVPPPGAGGLYEARITYNSGNAVCRYAVGGLAPFYTPQDGPGGGGTTGTWSIASTSLPAAGNSGWLALNNSDAVWLLGASDDIDGTTANNFTIEIREAGGATVLTQAITVTCSALVGIPD